MAWLSDLAGRAEDMLNKLDQNAATVLVSSAAATPLREVKCVPEDVPATELPYLPSQSPKPNRVGILAIEQELATANQGQTAEEELAALKIVLVDIKIERDELKGELSTLLNQLHIRNSGRQRVAELEREVSELKENNNQLTLTNKELADAKYVQGRSISELQLSGAQYKQSLMEAQEKLSFALEEAQRATTELANYRSRAQSSLQLKERIIEGLRVEDRSTASTEATTLLGLEIEQLRIERKDNLAELANIKLQLEGHQLHIGKLEERLSLAATESTRCQTELLDKLARVEKTRKELNHEMTLLKADLHAVRTQSAKSNESLTQQLYEKEREIAGLRKRSNTMQETGGSLDNRIKTLTQSLIQKQTTLEEITADRNSMRIQLEKVELEYHGLLSQQHQLQRSGGREGLSQQLMTDDDKAQLPLFIQENPFDNRLAKRMKRVIRASDSVGALLGGFLRRYPLLRILFLIYTVLLHVWVMVVLMSSTPNN